MRKSWCPDPYGVVVELQRKPRPGEKIALDLPAYAVHTIGDVSPAGLEKIGSLTFEEPMPIRVGGPPQSGTRQHQGEGRQQDLPDSRARQGGELSTLAWTGVHKIWPVHLVPEAKRGDLQKNNPLLQY